MAVKLFLPLYPTDGPREARVARALAGRLPARTPQVLHKGTLEGWVYLVFDRLPGRPWRETGGTPSLARQVGQVVAALREVPAQGLAEADTSWAEYLAFQEGAWLERQRGYGTPERLLSELEALVASTPRPPPARLRLLHADRHWDHVMVEGDRVTGIYNFGDSRVGDPAYEHTTIVCFLTPLQPAQLRAYLEGAGLDPDDSGLGDSLIA